MALLDLTETMVEQLFPKMGQRFKFLKHLKKLKTERVRISIILYLSSYIPQIFL